MEEREGKIDQSRVATSPQPVGGAWASPGQRVPLAVGPRPPSRPAPTSRALPRFFSPYLGHPNSDFESIFGLRTMTPSRTTKTTQL